MDPFKPKIWGMIITKIIAVIEIGQGCMLSRTLILELGRGCLFSSITSEKQWLRSKKGRVSECMLHTLPPLPPWIFQGHCQEDMNVDYGGGWNKRSFSNNDRDDNEKVKKSNKFIKQNNNYHTFLFISLPSLQDCSVKCLISHFTENVNLWQWIFLSLSKPQCSPQEFNSKEICLHLSFSANRNKRDIKVKKMRIHFKSDIFAAIIVVDAC